MSTSDDDMIPMKEFKHIEVPIIKIVTNDSSNDISNIPIITLTEPDPDDYGEFRIKGGLISENFQKKVPLSIIYLGGRIVLRGVIWHLWRFESKWKTFWI